MEYMPSSKQSVNWRSSVLRHVLASNSKHCDPSANIIPDGQSYTQHKQYVIKIKRSNLQFLFYSSCPVIAPPSQFFTSLSCYVSFFV